MRGQRWIDAGEVGGVQAALDALPTNGGTVHIPAGRWEVDAPLTLDLTEGQHLHLTGNGRASNLVNKSRTGAPLLLITGAVGERWPDLSITIRDLAFTGNYESGHGLVIDHPNDTMIDACVFLRHGGNAIHLDGKGTNATIRDCRMRDCKRAVFAQNLHHLTLHGNHTLGLDDGESQEEHLYIDRNCREVRIVNNHLAYGDAEGILLDGTAQHVISGNTIEGFERCISVLASRDLVISSNYLHGPTAVQLAGRCNGITITGNTMINNPEAAIRMEDASGSGGHVISSNIIRKSVYADITGNTHQGGVDLADARDCVVHANLLEEVTSEAAISALRGGGHVVSGNRIVRCIGEPVRLTCDTWCAIADNLTDRAERRPDE